MGELEDDLKGQSIAEGSAYGPEDAAVLGAVSVASSRTLQMKRPRPQMVVIEW